MKKAQKGDKKNYFSVIMLLDLSLTSFFMDMKGIGQQSMLELIKKTITT